MSSLHWTERLGKINSNILIQKLALSPPASYQDVTSGLGRSLESPALILYPEYFFLEKKEREGEGEGGEVSISVPTANIGTKCLKFK